MEGGSKWGGERGHTTERGGGAWAGRGMGGAGHGRGGEAWAGRGMGGAVWSRERGAHLDEELFRLTGGEERM